MGVSTVYMDVTFKDPEKIHYLWFLIFLSQACVISIYCFKSSYIGVVQVALHP